MSIKTIVSLSNKLSIEPLFTATRFVSCHEQNRLTFCVERKGYPPFTVCRTKA